MRFFAILSTGLLSLLLLLTEAGADDLAAHLVNRPDVGNWVVWGSGQTHGYLRTGAMPGHSIVRVEVAGPGKNAWDVQAHADVTDDIHSGDRVTAAFWARAYGPADVYQSRAHITALIHDNASPYTALGQAQIEIGQAWKLFFVHGKASASYAARHAGFSLQLASAKQTIEIGPLFILLNDRQSTSALESAFQKYTFTTTVEDFVAHNREANVDLAATFRAPAGKGPFPTVLLVTGHGPQTRGGFKLLSDVLVQHGIATAEYDKRGCGESTGTFSTATLSDLTSDAVAVAAYLKSHHDVDPGRVGLLGASEGTVIIPAIAARDPSYAFVVLIGAVARPMEDLALDQWETANRAAGTTEDKIVKGRQLMKQLYDGVIAARSDEEAQAGIKTTLAPLVADKAITQEQANEIVTRLADRPTREGLALDPRINLSEVKVPILAINGSLDLQVPASKNFPFLRQATAKNFDVTTIEVPGLNHNLQKAKTGTVEEWSTLGMPYSDQPTNELIANWIGQRVRGRGTK